MNRNQQLTELKDKIKASIRRNSDRGFIPYSGCNRVCAEMMSIMEQAETNNDALQAFEIYIMVLQEAIKLISHADTSSGAAGDVIHGCLSEIDKLCQTVAEENHKHFFDTIIKAAKNKAFKDWPEDGYRLLKSTVCFVCNEKQAQKVYEVFPALGTMYDGKDYPDKLLITLHIIEKLEGKEAADKYLMDNIDVPELRMIAVENALAVKNYPLAEKLCIEALKKNPRGHFNKPAPWAYYLERLYAETANEEKLTEMVRFILLHWDSSYFKKLKEIYLQKGRWDLERELLLEELSKVYMPHLYAMLLAQEGEVQKLLDVIMKHKSYITDHGKQLAESFPEETYKIYKEYILEEAKEATDRGKYRSVCKIIKNFYEAGAKTEAIEMIDRLNGMYQRRPAMIEELAGLKKKLSK
ncbi:hypothetical protein [Pseudobacteroides cellulosolvens]|uniref:Uncharacterized protein n=1 Tax=Pseudobacteroides cellulosolvens ATCC 35603 = DSM 2933 TaxID=398512 RepID=A0A0L6JTI4_9FIRM|nr:hypothetical protein [Pseudobacteroides cellulosolvens]KNY28995.1 hypothetical protein Bccel_4269 [Pseudobacteroides cellulosolvens ATCC 35603 = DSM 2933]